MSKDEKNKASALKDVIDDIKTVMIQTLTYPSYEMLSDSLMNFGLNEREIIQPLLQLMKEKEHASKASKILRLIFEKTESSSHIQKIILELIQTLSNDLSAESKMAILYLLGEIGCFAISDISPTIIKIIKEEEEEKVRDSGIIAIGSIAKNIKRSTKVDVSNLVDQFIPVLTESYKNNESADIRRNCIWALGMIGGTSVYPIILDAMKNDEDEIVRSCAVFTIKWNNYKNAIEDIRSELEKPKSETEKYEFAKELAELEDEIGVGIKILQEMKLEGLLNQQQLFEFESINYKHKVRKQEEKMTSIISKLSGVSDILKESEVIQDIIQKEKLDATFTILNTEIMELKSAFNEIQEELMTTKEASKRDIEDFKEKLTFPHLETFLHEQSLQKQITDLKDEITYVRKRADDKISIKDEFVGAWKVIISLSFLASLVLIVLKIIEAVQNMG